MVAGWGPAWLVPLRLVKLRGVGGVVAGEEAAGVGGGDGGDLLGRAVGDDAAAAFAAFGAHVEDVVGVADDVEVVLDDDDGVAEVGEAVEDFEELADVVEVEAGGGLVEEVEGAAGLALGELAGELHALGFAAGEGGGGLAEVDVAEAYVDEGLELDVDGGDVFEDGDGVFDGEVEEVGDGVAVELDGEGLLIVTASVTYFAEDVDVGEEVHLDAALAFALAGFAASALDVEGEAAGLVAALAGLGEHGEEVADGGEDAGVGGGVRAWGAADGGLVDLDDFVELVDADDAAVLAGLFAGAVEFFGEGAVEDVVDEGGFSAAADSGDDGHDAEREVGGDVLEVVGVGVFDGDPVAGEFAGFGAGEDFDFAGEVLAGEGGGVVHDLLGGAVGDEVAAVFAGSGAEVEDVVGFADGVFVVLDDEDGVAEVAEVFEGVDEALVVALVEADGGLVEDVEDAAEARADLRGEADALAFAAGEGGGGAVEGEVAEADGVEEFEALDDLALEAVGDDAVAAGEVHALRLQGAFEGRAVKSAMEKAWVRVRFCG